MDDPGRFAGCEGFTFPNLVASLCAIGVLALVVPPTIATMVNEHRMREARADTVRIAIAIARFGRDVRQPDGDGRVELLVGPGETPRSDGTWERQVDTLQGQLVDNVPGYRVALGTEGLGWKGPYLTRAETGPDPWGNRYSVTVGLLDVPGATSPSARDDPSEVWVISAGPNGVLDTPYGQLRHTAILAGDDIGVRVDEVSERLSRGT